MDCIYKGSVVVGTGTQWPLVQRLLGVRQECASKPCLAAATMERHLHPLFQRLKDAGEGKQRSLETVRDWEMTNHSNYIFPRVDWSLRCWSYRRWQWSFGRRRRGQWWLWRCCRGRRRRGWDKVWREQEVPKREIWWMTYLSSYVATLTRLLSGRAHPLPGTEKARLLRVSWGRYHKVIPFSTPSLQEVFMCDQCEKTLYGCCPDLQNAAAGIFP